tara:strand:- start:676 stop:1047 length:372 start_codon:yes stop_codon:yes gene_type:complete
MDLIDYHIKKRICKAFRIMPFNPSFYEEIKSKGLSSDFVYRNAQKYCVKGSKWFKSSSSVEDSFQWLIKLGILRREVDGQGLTSRIRLTPLGRKILEIERDLPNYVPKYMERIFYCIVANFRL